MAIHHDKHAYGNLEKLDGEMSENDLMKMLSALKEEDGEEENKREKTEEKDEKKDERNLRPE